MSRNFDLLQSTGQHTSESLSRHDFRRTAMLHDQNGNPQSPGVSDETNWLYLWSLVFQKHWRLSAVFAGGCLGAVLLLTLLMKPIYEPAARLEISPPGAELFRLERQAPIATDAEYLETQAREIESDALEVEVIRAMDLAHNRQFMSKSLLGRLFAGISLLSPSRHKQATTTRALSLTPDENEALKRFQDNLTVKRDTASRLVTVSFASPDPALAAEITNTLVGLFVERCYQARHDAIMQSTQWLSRQLDDIRAKMEQSNRAVVAFQRANNIADVDKDRSTVTDNMAELSRQKTQAETDRIQLEAYLHKVRNGGLDALPQTQANPVIQQLSQKLAETRADLAQATTLLGDNHPTVRKLRRGVKELESQIGLQQKAILAQLQTSYAAALSRERMIGGEMKGASRQLNEVAEYASLKREAQANTDLYNTLYAKVKETGIAAASNSSNIRVVDEARVLNIPTRPKPLFNLGLGLALSLTGSFILPFMRERLTNRLRDTNDVRRWTGLSSIAAVPLAAGEGRRNGGGLLLFNNGRMAENDSPAKFLLGEPQSPQAEALRGVETALMLSALTSPPQVMLVASSIPGEGKTTVVINLATSLARHGRTCIIDADLRRSKVASSFNLQSKTGLAQYLTGTDEINNIVFAAPEVSNVSIVPAGTRVQDPGTLIFSARMRELVQSLRREYEYILIDSPPILLYADGRALSPLVDGVVFVARVGSVSRDALVRSVELLNQVHSAPILQVVVNGAAEVPNLYANYYARAS